MAGTRQQILEGLAGRLVQISPGKVFNLADGPHICGSSINKVQAWRKNPYRISELPAIAWRDGITGREARETGKGYRNRMRVMLAVYLTGNSSSATTRNALQDMLAAIGSDPRCGGLAHRIELQACRMITRTAADVVTAGLVDLSITYTSTITDPVDGLIDEDTWEALIDETTGQTVIAEPAT